MAEAAPTQEDLEVLQGGDELILDGLFGETAPAEVGIGVGLCGLTFLRWVG